MSNQDRPASEDSRKAEHQKKIKDSPEEKRQKRIEEEVKEKEELLDDIEDVATIKRIAKKEIRSQVRRRLLEEEEKVDYKTKYEAAKRDKEQAIGKKIGYKMKLNGRGSLDFAEDILLPLWLRNTDLTRSQQWTISLRFGLRPHAVAVMNVLKKSKKTKKLQPSTIGRIIEEIYDDWAKTFTHRRRLDLPTTDGEWENMFHTLKIDAENKRRLLQAIFEETAGVSEDDDSTEETEVDSAQRGFVIIKNVNGNSKLSNIMEFFQNRKIVVHSIEHLVDSRYTPSRKSNTIVAFVENIHEATHPSVITKVPSNLCYPTDWEVQDKFLCSEP